MSSHGSCNSPRPCFLEPRTQRKLWEQIKAQRKQDQAPGVPGLLLPLLNRISSGVSFIAPQGERSGDMDECIFQPQARDLATTPCPANGPAVPRTLLLQQAMSWLRGNLRQDAQPLKAAFMGIRKPCQVRGSPCPSRTGERSLISSNFLLAQSGQLKREDAAQASNVDPSRSPDPRTVGEEPLRAGSR